MSEDLIKVIIEYRNAPDKSKVDTGLFKQIYQGRNFTKLVRSCGLNLVCEGKKSTI